LAEGWGAGDGRLNRYRDKRRLKLKKQIEAWQIRRLKGRLIGKYFNMRSKATERSGPDAWQALRAGPTGPVKIKLEV
jgi:hypothetical protein